jgi:hypothetical protein
VIYGKASGFTTLDMLSFTSSDSTGFIIQGAAADDQLGISVSGAGDVNGDGYADVIVGASYADPNSRDNAGAAYVIWGNATGLMTVDLANFTGDSRGYVIQVCVCVCVCVCMCVWMCVCVCVCMCVWICVWMCVCVCVYVCMDMCMDVCVCMYVCVYGCACVLNPLICICLLNPPLLCLYMTYDTCTI